MIRKKSCFGPRHTIAFLICLSACALFIAACGSRSGGKRYQLTGKVLSVAPEEGSANIDADAIPGFMAAMAMPYPIPDQKALASLSAGDEIAADVVVTGDGKYHLENVVVTKKGDAGAAQASPPAENVHEPQPGEKVPDFSLVNQDGKKIHLDSFKGKVTLITFIYTQCPFADYCPLVSRNFAQIYAGMRSKPELSSKLRLLSISFDPAHDTPQVLRQYGLSFSATTGGKPFDRWEFATAPAQDLGKIAQFFGVYYDTSQKIIVHSLSTSVVSPDGTIYKWYSGNEWKPSDLIDDATKALAAEKAGA